MDKQSIIEGETAPLSQNAFTKSGYTFSGWSITAAGGVAYTNGASYKMESSDVTLFAVWTPKASHTITFDGNDEDAVGTMDKQSIIEGETAPLSQNAFTKSGYTFSGWSITAVGDVAYTNGASYKMGTSDVTLYAVWKPKASHTITFDGNDEDAIGTMDKQSIIEGETAPLSQNAFTKSGYTFDGWSITAAGAVAYTNGANYKMESSDVTLFAIWTPEP